ncbi:LPS export ABC transporter permease LptG [Arenibaculum pallidiluteum]|uniref:LPS export ABC transporter permease LptG n=1 Tax=Arenibaculum pallidiluteum TaxID=2812559 RepID=UPI001A96666A|nr:LPS export ABC transporter permease LptG [Arenibaculum pallidiluteum]
MAFPRTLSRYIGRQFLAWFLALLLVILAIILLLDIVELLRRAVGKPQANFAIVMQMGLLKLPEIGQQAFPFVVLFSAMFTFWRLTRSQELVVARAVGVSAWQFLAPVLVLAPLVAVIQVTVINPLGSILVARYERMEDFYLRGRQSSLAVGQSGLWLLQGADEERWLIHAEQVRPGTLELQGVTMIRIEGDEQVRERVDAPVALLLPGRWEIPSGWLNRPEMPTQAVTDYRVPTTLTFERIAEGLAAPRTMGFWALPGFIKTLEATGLSAVRHRLQYQSLLSQPLLFCAMVLFAAAFSLRQTRRGGTLLMVAGGVATGFVLFVLTDVVLAFGISETIPVVLAAWAPAVASLLISIAVLLHLEDG